MGCDIHIYRERFTNGKWESIDKWTKYSDEEGSDVAYGDQCYEGRNYDLFGVLSKGVRREFPFSFEARGLPLQCDERIRDLMERWGSDGHSHSYLYLHELRELLAWAKSNAMPVSGMMNREQLHDLEASIESGSPNWDKLYPFCQWGTSPDLVDFKVEVPVDFKIGNCLAEIVNSFDGVDGENHRVVFCFDN